MVKMLHCPRDVPVAILTVPKSGTTSAINWAMLMDGDERISLARGAEVALQNGPNAFMHSWLLPELSKVVNRYGVDGWDEEIMNRLFYRAMHRLRWPAAHQKFIPPAHLCPPCCMYGHGRQFVVVARNPFVRLTSYFRFTLLNEHRRNPPSPWTSWAHFGNWIRFVIGIRASKGASAFANDLGWADASYLVCYPSDEDGKIINETAEATAADGSSPQSSARVRSGGMQVCERAVVGDLESSDIHHIRPLSDMVHDRRFAAGSAAFDAGRVHVVHLETIAADVVKLEALLCKHFGYCSGLPRFPQVLPGVNILESRQLQERCLLDYTTLAWHNCSAPPWESLWAAQDMHGVALSSTALSAYGDDFRWLGYSVDPTRLMPLESSS